MVLKLTGTVDKKTYNISLSPANSDRLFLSYKLQLPEGLPDGIYQYELLDENDILTATGLVQIGDFKENKTTYTSEHNGYKQYRG